MKFFSMDSPLMVALSKMADLLWLNILTLLCCIPIVTVGASLTAMHYMALKIARNEETYITKGFFKSFKENFKQGTIIWLIQIVVFGVLLGDYYILFFTDNEFNTIMQILLYSLTVVVLLTSVFVYPVLAKFENTIKKTLINALTVSVLQLPKAIVMMILFVLPAGLLFTQAGLQIFPLLAMFGFSVPAFISAKLYNKFFEKLENKVLEENPEETEDLGSEDEHIFSDELDPSIAAREDLQ